MSTQLHGDVHKPENWYTECGCPQPDDLPDDASDEEYAAAQDAWDDTHVSLDEIGGYGCEKSLTDVRCSTCSYGGDYPDVLWPCASAVTS